MQTPKGYGSCVRIFQLPCYSSKTKDKNSKISRKVGLASERCEEIFSLSFPAHCDTDSPASCVAKIVIWKQVYVGSFDAGVVVPGLCSKKKKKWNNPYFQRFSIFLLVKCDGVI